MPCGRSRSHETEVVTHVAAGTKIVPSWKLGNGIGMWPRRDDWLVAIKRV